MKHSRTLKHRLARAALLLTCPLLLVGTLHAGQPGGGSEGKAKGKDKNKHATVDPADTMGCSEGVVTLAGEQYCAESILEITMYGDEALAYMGLTEPPTGWAWWSVTMFFLIGPDGRLEYITEFWAVVGPAV